MYSESSEKIKQKARDHIPKYDARAIAYIRLKKVQAMITM
jgi:hypothetical protein